MAEASAGKIEPESAAFLDRIRTAAQGSQPSPLGRKDPESMRASAIALLKAFGPKKLPVREARRQIILSEGREVPVQIYWPEDGGAEDHPGSGRPIVLYFHGGGWTHFSAETHDGVARHLCNKAGCIVVNVDYRLSPEHKFPAALEDTYDVLRWVSANADSLGGDAHAIVAAGESAGGTLSIALCLLTKSRGGPKIAVQIPMCPSLDLSGYEQYDSWKRLGNGEYLVSKASLEQTKDAYFQNQGDVTNPLASPIFAADLSDLPPALVITAEFDPLVDQGEHYVRRLRASGVPVDYRCFEGTIHSFMILAGAISLGYRALDLVAERVRAAASPQTPGN
jgi:acetyl esterase